MKHLLHILFLLPIISDGQIITTFAGGGTSAPNGIPAITAQIPGATGGVFDSHFNYYFVGYSTSALVYKIDTAGIITVFAGTGIAGYNGDGGKADTSMLRQPYAVIVDSIDNVYIADAGNNRIRKIDVIAGIISTISGNGIAGFSGDGGLAINAVLNFPDNICFDKNGNLYIADGNNFRIRVINTLGTITTYAGNGTVGIGGNGGPATLAQILAYGLCVDDSNNLYFAGASVGQCRIGKINVLTDIVTTIGGTDTGYVYNGDNIPATLANMAPTTIRFDNTFKNLYLTDCTNNRIRTIDANGIIHTVVGNGIEGFSGDNGNALDAELYYPSGLIFDSCGNLYFGDQFNNRIRKAAFNAFCWPEKANNILAQTISVYPNPTYDILNINNITTPATYILLNIIGTTLQQGTLKARDNSISVQSLPPGIYMIVLTDNKQQKTVRKIVKE